jgi:acyl-[acyl carrier protein]--UDP-N-acetylglucosamine O-acyltransferase
MIFRARRLAMRVAGLLWLALYRRRRPNVVIGRGLILNGLPVFIVGRHAIVRIGKGVTFTSSLRFNMVGLFKRCSVYVSDSGELLIGDGSGFSGVSIHCVNSIRIGVRVTCGGNTALWDNDFHALDSLARHSGETTGILSAPIVVGDDAFIGANSIVLKGVTIGARAIIGAGSVVTRNVPSDEVWAGNPARRVRSSA